MKRIVIFSVLLAASAAHADENPAMTAGKAWLTAALDGGTLTAPTKAKPFTYAVQTDTKACHKTLVGSATNAKTLEKFRKCLVTARKELNSGDELAPIGEWRVDEWEAGTEMLATKKQNKAINKAAKGATVVATSLSGVVTTMNVYIAVAPDGTVRGVWMQEMSNE